MIVPAGLWGEQRMTAFVRSVTFRRKRDRGRVRLERRLGHDHLVAPLERGERQEAEQLVGAVAGDELLGPDAEAAAERLAERSGTAVGIQVHARRLAGDRGDDAG